jgi:hypothetical protein
MEERKKGEKKENKKLEEGNYGGSMELHNTIPLNSQLTRTSPQTC